jgi:sugar phosphate isomerase/epimerase
MLDWRIRKRRFYLSKVKFCLFASTPDMLRLGFVVKVLTGTPEELGKTTMSWGYDGIEFMPDPERTPDPELFSRVLGGTGAVMPVVNSGRIAAQGMALLHEDMAIQKKAIDGFKRMLDFAGYFKARVGLGASLGKGIPGMSKDDKLKLAEEIFRELTGHAEKAEAIIMLESAEAEYTNVFNTNEEVMTMVEAINSPNFSIMLDTHQLYVAEPSIEYGIRAAKGLAKHIHLREPSRLPPGVSTEKEALDWPNIVHVLGEEGFEGSASVIIAPKGDPEPIARKSVAYLRKIFEDNS